MGNGESVQVGSPVNGGSQFSFNGHRTPKRNVEDDYVDLGNDTETFSKEQMEDQFIKIVDAMDLPNDKHQVVMGSTDEKKWQLVRDNTRRIRQNPPREYLSRLRQVKESNDTGKRARKRATEPATIQALQGLEISLRTNDISWVKEFLSDGSCGLRELVHYMMFRYHLEIKESNLILNKSSLNRVRSTENLILGSKSKLSPPTTSRQINNRTGNADISDIHICVLCLKALMNNTHGFAAVMKDPDAITCMALSMFYGTYRTSITVIELLAAICLVKGGHIKIMQAVDNFKKENGEKHRFEKLVEYFMDPCASAEFQGACMNFINVIVHSADDMNYRVHLQHEFTLLGLDEYIETTKDSHHVAPILVSQISAYQQNYFNVDQLNEDSQTKLAALATVQEMEKKLLEQQDQHQAAEFQSLKRIADLEKKIADLEKMAKKMKENEAVPATPPSGGPPPPPPPPPPPGGPCAAPPPPPPPPCPGAPGAPPPPPCPGGAGAPPPPPPPGGFVMGGKNKSIGLHPNKRKIETKYKLPLLNWAPIPATQIAGTVFTQLDDENVLKLINFSDFEETFKTKSQAGSQPDKGSKKPLVSSRKKKVVQESLLDQNRSQNVAIAKKRLTLTSCELSQAIVRMDLGSLPIEMVEIICKIIPNEDERKKFDQFTKEKKNPSILPDNDKFLYDLHQVERLKVRINVMIFMGNFEEDLALLSPQVDAVIAAAKSVVASKCLKTVFEIILAFGNYMNSSKRGGVYGFKLQSLDILLDTKAPSDRSITFVHYLAKVVREQYSEALDFLLELTYLEKAATVSLDLLAADTRVLAKGIKEATGELISNKKNENLKRFCLETEPIVTKLHNDLETAREAFLEVVQFFGCNAKTTQPNSVFPVLHRFVEGFRKCDAENLAKIAIKRAQMMEVVHLEDDGRADVLPHIYDGAIDEIITEMKTAAYRPAHYRKNTLSRKASKASSAQDELMRSLKVNTDEFNQKERKECRPTHKH